MGPQMGFRQRAGLRSASAMAPNRPFVGTRASGVGSTGAGCIAERARASQGCDPAAGLQQWRLDREPAKRPDEAQKRELGLWERAMAVAMAMVVSGVVQMTPAVAPAEARTALTQEERRIVDMFRESTPSVVNVTNLAQKRDAFTLDLEKIPQSTGSGVVWDSDGHVVTNYHVVLDATDVQVRMADGLEYSASLVGVDKDRDIAVLKLVNEDHRPLQPLTLGDSADLVVGQQVLAIGNPFGLDHTLTTGVISGTGREIASGITGRPIQDVIQTDAAINPGNSGGPLLDSGGTLIGINTQIISTSGASNGVGFAIPVDVVKSSVSQIIVHGHVIRPVMGISFAPDTSTSQLGLKGILVLNAREGGPAWKAGIKGTSRDQDGRLVLGDIIVSVNGSTIKTASDLYRLLDRLQVGDVMDLEVLRQQAKEHVSLILESSA